MIQLNLLPDVKMAYIKAQRTRRLMLSISVLIAVAAIALLVLLLSVSGLQKKHLNDLSSDIKSESQELESRPQIDRMLTVQNQLNSLTPLHAESPAAARLFSFLNQVTPANVNITDLKIDFTQQTATITGTSDSLVNVNKYIDTLKLTTFTVDGEDDSQPAFSDIVLSSFSLDTGSDTPGQAANYTISLSYDQTIFDANQDVKLSVSNVATTRSEVAQPNALFQNAPAQGGR